MSAIETQQARQAFHSTYYSKRRKRNQNSPPHRGPQVGRIGTVEEAMLDDNFLEYLSSIKPIQPHFNNSDGSNNSFWKSIRLLTIVVVTALLWFGFDSDLVEVSTFCVLLALLGINHLVSKNRDTDMTYYYSRQWLCLKCKHHWVKSKKLKEQ